MQILSFLAVAALYFSPIILPFAFVIYFAINKRLPRLRETSLFIVMELISCVAFLWFIWSVTVRISLP